MRRIELMDTYNEVTGVRRYYAKTEGNFIRVTKDRFDFIWLAGSRIECMYSRGRGNVRRSYCTCVMGS